MFHVEDELPELHLNLLEPGRRSRVEAHLLECAGCARRSTELGATLAALGSTANHSGIVGLARRLHGGRRFHHFTPQVAQLFDLEEDTARGLLDTLDVEGAWSPILPGLDLMPVRPGTRCRGALSAFVRLQAGAAFPHHRHTGRERTFVLQGGYLDSRGRELWRGEHDPYEAGSEHAMTALPGVPCIAASVLWGDSPFKRSPAAP